MLLTFAQCQAVGGSAAESTCGSAVVAVAPDLRVRLPGSP
jgi:hypothetical protein